MGLDMYLYRIRKLDEDEIDELNKIDYEKLCRLDFTILTLADEDDMARVRHIRPWITVVKKDVRVRDYDAIKREAGIPEDAHLSGSCYTNGRTAFIFRKDKQRYEMCWEKFTQEQRDRCTGTATYDIAVWRESEVAYWRKEYKLQTRIHSACSTPILNCGYYPLNDEMRKVVLAYEKSREDGRQVHAADLESTDSSVVCYHEWY